MNPINRKLAYIGRVFYLHDYAKELRMGGMAEHLMKDYQSTSVESIIGNCKNIPTTDQQLTIAMSILYDRIMEQYSNWGMCTKCFLNPICKRGCLADIFFCWSRCLHRIMFIKAMRSHRAF